MKIETSQLEYLSKRKKDYNLKYSILKTIINNNIHKNNKVLELFGGIGLTSFLIQKKNPEYHDIVEIDNNCVNILKTKFPLIKIIKSDAFDYFDLEGYDFIFLDVNGFTLKKEKEFVKLFNNIKNYNPKATLILTETGIYNTIFSKESPESYYERINNYFKENYGWYIQEVNYTRKFAVLIIKQYPIDIMILKKWDVPTLNWQDLKMNK